MAKKTLLELQEFALDSENNINLEQAILLHITESDLQEAQISALEERINLEQQLLFDWYNL